jgi:hypothetical protein
MENEGLKLPAVEVAKLRCDSAWAGLSSEQRETVESWLFEEGLGYAKVVVTDKNG